MNSITNNEKIDIIDISYLREVTYQEILEHENKIFILRENLVDFLAHEKKYKITREQFMYLIRSNILTLYNLSSSYSDISTHDIFIYFATLVKFEYDVTVYTCNDVLAVDLLLLNIKVKSVKYKYSNKFTNIENDSNDNIVYVYDTSYLISNLFEIDFSKNKHVLLSCVLEELIRPNVKDLTSVFFAIIYLIGIYPNNFEIINTASYTQKNGRYSYTDLLILISSLNLVNSGIYKDKKVIFKVIDKDLLTDAISTEKINVSPDFENNYSKPNKKSLLTLITESPNKYDFNSQETDDINISMSEYIVSITNNFTKINIIRPFNQAAIEISNIIECIYTNNLHPAQRVHSTIKDKLGISNNCYWIKKGYFIKFIGIDKFYRIKSIHENIALIEEF